MEKISWVKREIKRTRKLPSKATIIVTMITSHTPTQTRPTMYSISCDLQNWMGNEVYVSLWLNYFSIETMNITI